MNSPERSAVIWRPPKPLLDRVNRIVERFPGSRNTWISMAVEEAVRKEEERVRRQQEARLRTGTDGQ